MPLHRQGEWGGDYADADESGGEGMDHCECVHKTEVDEGYGHQNLSVGGLMPTREYNSSRTQSVALNAKNPPEHTGS